MNWIKLELSYCPGNLNVCMWKSDDEKYFKKGYYYCGKWIEVIYRNAGT